MIRSLGRGHPGYDVLSRHADGELTASDAMELNSHLAACQQCRDEVDFIVELRRRLRELPVPRVPRALLPEVLSCRARGERKILGVASPEAVPERRGPGSAAASAAVVTLAALAFGLFGARDTEAGASRLVLGDVASGRPIPVAFRTGGALAGEATVTLRGVAYAAPSTLEPPGPGSFVEATLERQRTGSFVGEIELPGSAVFARFVAEDPTGTVLEGAGPDWVFVARGPDGNPTFEALIARFWIESEREPRAIEAAREATRLYPNEPGAWWLLSYAEARLGLLSGATLDAHRARASAFERAAPDMASADWLAALVEYAAMVGAEDLKARLLARLEARAPNHRVAANWRTARIFGEFQENPEALLATLEAEWQRHGPTELLLHAGFWASREVEDHDAVARWIERRVAAEPAERTAVGFELAEIPGHKRLALSLLREELRELDGFAMTRPLGRTVEDHRAEASERRQALLRGVGELLLELEGPTAGALDTLVLAAEAGWDPALFAAVSELAEQLERPGTATRFLTRAAVDPLTGGAYLADNVARLAQLGVRDEDLGGRLEAARRDMRAMILAPQVVSHPEGVVRISSTANEVRDLAAELGPRATIIQFWSPREVGTGAHVQAVLAHCASLAAEGVRVIALALEPHGPDAVAEIDVPGACPDPWRVDGAREASLAFRRFVRAETLVLDDAGSVRFRSTAPTDALRAALLLASSP